MFTGLSGSGKSSLAFDTIYAEGQRRYVESLSSYARQFLGQMDKPDVDFIRACHRRFRSTRRAYAQSEATVGTITEVYDYLRLLFARIGVPHCPFDGTEVSRQHATADRRPRPAAAGGHAVPGARARCEGARGPTRRCSPTSLTQGFVRSASRRRGARAQPR